MVSSLSVGCFVITPSFGIGKIKAIDEIEGVARITFYRSISSAFYKYVSVSSINRTTLETQTRVYLEAEDQTWQMGWVAYSHNEDDVTYYAVNLPNSQVRLVNEVDLIARCLSPAVDPAEVLLAGGAESQLLYDHRAAVQAGLYTARAASGGLTGLLSSSITLVPYQMEIVHRILHDPIQRYLLADEVGMGKTIEAGVIARQCLLDHPTAIVQVVVPDVLVEQWKQELGDRCHLTDFPNRTFVKAFSDVAKLSPDGYDLLIIDEAHHLLAQRTEQQLQILFGCAQRSKRLLILTATPVINDNETTLALLHLLDPIAYPLDDQQGFQEKLNRRQEFGRLLLRLDPEASVFARKRLAQQLMQTFPHDEVIGRLAPQISGNEASATDVIASLKHHISETYRLHQRLLRSRRKDVTAKVFQPRSTTRPACDEEMDERIPSVADAIEEWRYQSLRALDASAHEVTLEQRCVTRFCAFFEILQQGVDRLHNYITEVQQHGQAALLFPDEQVLLQGIRSACTHINEEMTHVELAIESVLVAVKPLTAPHKVLVFSSSTETAQAVAKGLASALPRLEVVSVLAGMDFEAIHRVVTRFKNNPKTVVLVSDKTGEEGLNLHFVDTIVQLDLPLQLARIEQRLGRADRFGRQQQQLKHRVLMPWAAESSLWQTWFEILSQGFEIFATSISEVQFLLDDLEHEIIQTLYYEGALGGKALIASLKTRLQNERRRLDEQYALDRLSMDTAAQARFERLMRFEHAEVGAFASALLLYLRTDMGFHIDEDEEMDDVFTLRWSQKHTKLTKYPWMRRFTPALEKETTFRRSLAVASPSLALARPGAPLVNTAETYLRWEDRGMAFMTWRYVTDWAKSGREPWMGFCLSYIVEAQCADRFSEDIRPTVQRRVDALLSPWIETLFLGIDLAHISDPDLLAILRKPYNKEKEDAGYRDTNLASRHAVLEHEIDHRTFVEKCRLVRTESERLFCDTFHFQERIAQAQAYAQYHITQQNAQLERRAAALRREYGQSVADIDDELAINTAILQVIMEPQVRLDAIGFYIVAGTEPIVKG